METVYCFIEKEGEALKNFIEKYDNTCEIHIFSPISSSCERKLFFCLGEITNLFLETEEKTSFVTDVLEIYNYVCKMYHSYFTEVIYLEQGVAQVFDRDIDYYALFKYEMLQATNPNERTIIERLFSSLAYDDELGMCYTVYDALEDVENYLEDVIRHDNWKEKAFWIHALEMMLFYMNEEEWTDLSQITLYSILMRLEKNVNYTNKLLNLILESDKIKKDNWYFIWNQFKRIRLNGLADCNQESNRLLSVMYKKSYEAYYEQEKEQLYRIPQGQLNPKHILVMTIQYLTTDHAPTRTVIERCKMLMRGGGTRSILSIQLSSIL